MSALVAARKCVQHSAREAVARCPSCGGNFCAECVVEHDGRLLCTRCLALEKVVVDAPRGQAWPRVRSVMATALWVVFLWGCFYMVGAWMKAIPTTVHDGTVWRTTFAHEPPR